MTKLSTFAIVALAATFCVGCARTATHSFTYKNPITTDPGQSMRDHIIVKEGDKWYVTGTPQPVWDGPNPGTRLMVSDDLLHWRDTAWIIDSSKLPDDCPYKGRLYAPEIHKIGGVFYLVVNSGYFPNASKGQYWEANHRTWIFKSDDIVGPYDLLTKDGLSVDGYANDASLFGDDDGRAYIYCCHYDPGKAGLYQAEIDLSTGELLANKQGVKEFELMMTPDDPSMPDWAAGGIEGPYVIKRHGYYWMFFSTWTRGYEIGVLRADTPLGPWVVSQDEPVFGTRKHEVRDEMAVRDGYDWVQYEDTDDPYVEVGHNGVFEGPDGQDWICCHYWLRGTNVIGNPHVPIYDDTSEQLGFDPLHYSDGVWHANGPTWTEQTVTW